jgi:hypothetical protein
MLGVPIDGPANVLVDNDAVVKNSTIPSSTLHKKHNSISYHCVREAVAAQILWIVDSLHLAVCTNTTNTVISLIVIILLLSSFIHDCFNN